MLPDDPRHGEERGYFAHRKAGQKPCGPCTNGHRVAQIKRTLRTLEGEPAWVPALGTHRRIQALHRLGWTMTQIADEAGRSREQFKGIMRQEHVTRAVADMVADVYDRLSMRLPDPGDPWARGRVTGTIARATASGWPPPLAWDDGAIDDPDAEPAGHKVCSDPDCSSPVQYRGLCKIHYAVERGFTGQSTIGHRHKDLDLVRVYRILDGDYRLSCSELDKTEVCRRWVREGRSLEDLATLTGWRPGRYYKTGDAA